jgi:hypothetical protein
MMQAEIEMADEDADDRLYRWLEPPPTYVDHFSVRAFSAAGIMRMSFGEWLSRTRPAIYRVGLAMPISDARSLHTALGEALKEYDEKLTPKTQIKE